MIGRYLANRLVKEGLAPHFDNPENYDLEYDDVEFTASDGITLRGWLIKGNTDKVIIQTHFGLFCSRAGYTQDGKGMGMKAWSGDIQFLRQAKYLNEEGYTVLMYDLRNHGESDRAMDGYISYGPEEAKDVIAAVEYISSHPDYKDAAIGLLSICMGQGASVTAFGREDGLKNYPNIKTMISVQPLDYEHFLEVLPVPGFFKRRADNYIKTHTDFDYYDNTWRPYVKDVSVPVLMIQNLNDSFLDKEFVEGVFDDLQVEKEMMWLELPVYRNSTDNRIAAYDWVGTNPDPILKWFSKYV